MSHLMLANFMGSLLENVQRNTENREKMPHLRFEPQKFFFIGGGSLSKLYGTHGPGVYLLYNADAVNINTGSDLLVEWPSPSLSHKAAGLKSDVVNISYGRAIEIQ